MREWSVTDEFAHQAEAFDRAPVMSATETLAALLDLVPAGGGRWVEVACGTGIVSRELARRVEQVLGIDLTPAMLELARRGAVEAGLANVDFTIGDATALDLEDASFDGAITRFSLHHIPAPGRVLEELARVVRPGGTIVVGDHLGDEDSDGAAWHEEIERLRDPTHWACLTMGRLRAAGEAAGLALELERVTDLDLDFEEWLARGSGGPDSAPLIERLLSERPEASWSMQVGGAPGARRLRYRYGRLRWRRP